MSVNSRLRGKAALPSPGGALGDTAVSDVRLSYRGRALDRGAPKGGQARTPWVAKRQFQRHVLGPKSRFSWKGASPALPLAANSARICAELRRQRHAAYPSPEAQNMPHECTGRAQRGGISAPAGPKPRVFLPREGTKAAHFCTGSRASKIRRRRSPDSPGNDWARVRFPYISAVIGLSLSRPSGIRCSD